MFTKLQNRKRSAKIVYDIVWKGCPSSTTWKVLRTPVCLYPIDVFHLSFIFFVWCYSSVSICGFILTLFFSSSNKYSSICSSPNFLSPFHSHFLPNLQKLLTESEEGTPELFSLLSGTNWAFIFVYCWKSLKSTCLPGVKRTSDLKFRLWRCHTVFLGLYAEEP